MLVLLQTVGQVVSPLVEVCGVETVLAPCRRSSDTCSVAPSSPEPGDDSLWREVLGAAAERIASAARRLHHSLRRQVPGVDFSDQAKAFERMGLAWLRRVLEGWRLPMRTTGVQEPSRSTAGCASPCGVRGGSYTGDRRTACGRPTNGTCAERW